MRELREVAEQVEDHELLAARELDERLRGSSPRNHAQGFT